MAALLKIQISFTLLLICSTVRALELKNFTKTWSSKENVEYFVSNDIDTPDNSFLYASCKNAYQPRELHCNITIDTPSVQDKTWTNVTCSMKFKSNLFLKNDVKLEIIDLRRFGGEIVAVTWLQTHQIRSVIALKKKVTFVYPSNCSSTDILSLNIYDGEYFVEGPIYYSGTFDIIPGYNTICNTDSPCRMTYNQTGDEIGDQIPFLVKDFDRVEMHSIDSKSPSKGFYVRGWRAYENYPIVFDNYEFEIQYIDPAGNASNIFKDNVYKQDDVYNLTKSSNANEFYGLCYRRKEFEVQCVQYECEENFSPCRSKLRLNATVHIQSSDILRDVHNLIDDGMIVFTENSNDKNNTYWEVRMINSKFQEEPLKLDFKCSSMNNSKHKVVVNETRKDLIFYLACVNNVYDSETKEILESLLEFSVRRISKNSIIDSD